MKVDGACHCGSIRYEAEADPAKAMYSIWDCSPAVVTTVARWIRPEQRTI